MTMFVIGLGLLGLGLWFIRDGHRLERHLVVAKRLMDAGVLEPEAMERSGCNWWDIPWYRRLLETPPSIDDRK